MTCFTRRITLIAFSLLLCCGLAPIEWDMVRLQEFGRDDDDPIGNIG